MFCEHANSNDNLNSIIELQDASTDSNGRVSPLLQAIGVLGGEKIDGPLMTILPTGETLFHKSIAYLKSAKPIIVPAPSNSTVWFYYLDDEPTKSQLYKTEQCRAYELNKTCRYGKKCKFWHTNKDRRPKPIPRKFKTKLCKSYEKEGYCNYGRRCRFIHKELSVQFFSYQKDSKLPIIVGSSPPANK